MGDSKRSRDQEESHPRRSKESEVSEKDTGSTSDISRNPQVPPAEPGRLEEVQPEDVNEVAENLGLDQTHLSRAIGAEGEGGSGEEVPEERETESPAGERPDDETEDRSGKRSAA